MKTYRDYTGLERTPSNLAWLLRQRWRIRGSIDKRTKILAELPKEIAELKKQLASLDRVIKRHPVEVNTEAIEGRRPHQPSIFKGHKLTRQIISCLKDAAGEPMPTTLIVYAVAKRCEVAISPHNYADVKRPVAKILRALALQKRVVRHHATDTGNNDEGSWSMPPVMD